MIEELIDAVTAPEARPELVDEWPEAGTRHTREAG